MVDDQVAFTAAQVKALFTKFQQTPDVVLSTETARETFHQFIDKVQPVFGGDGAITVPWFGMHLCIEKDGYTHT